MPSRPDQPEQPDHDRTISIPEAARDPQDQPLQEVVTSLDAQGFDGQFRAGDDATIQCLTCRETFPASTLSADDVTRLEGASDPADMAIVIPLECPHCAARGTFIANYGPEAAAEDAEVLAALERTPNEGSGGIATPGVG